MVAVFMSVLRYLNAVKKNKEGNQIQMWDMEIPGEVTIREVFRAGKCGNPHHLVWYQSAELLFS